MAKRILQFLFRSPKFHPPTRQPPARTRSILVNYGPYTTVIEVAE